jgi:ribokinase
MNPAPAQKLDDYLLKGLFLITPNETEASLLTGIPVNDKASAHKAAGFFLERGVHNVIITLGAQGAYFRNNTEEFILKAPAVNAVDTTAAGDTFNGAIAVALTDGMNWTKAIEFAIEAASISVTRLGAQSSIPSRKEILISK